jgi:lysophospholipase L1-like esterase
MSQADQTSFLKPSDRVLFQGDSITDCGRNRGDDAGDSLGRHLGCGYAAFVSGRVLADRPSDGLEFFNLGISGNRIVDLAARIKEHGWNLKPTVLSILIGVNDTWHGFSRNAGVELARFERTYRHLLEDSRHALPGLRFVLCEPFVLPCGVVGPGWKEDVDKRRAIVVGLASEFDAVFVPFQSVFDEACRLAPATHWAPDGVHPSPAGHQLMADAWLSAVGHRQRTA